MAITIGATWLLYISGILILWTPLPLLYRYGQSGRSSFLASALIALLGLMALYGALLSGVETDSSGWENYFALPGFAFKEHFAGTIVISAGAIYFFYYLAIAGVLGWVQERKLSVELSFGLAVAGPLLGGLIIVLFVSLWFGIDIVSEIRGYMLHVLDKIIEIGTPAGLSPQDLRYITTRREEIAERVLSMIPAAAVIGTLISVWGNVLVARIWFPRLARGSKSPLFRHFGNLSRWRLTERFIWLAIGAGCLYFLDYYISRQGAESGVSLIGMIATNVLWIVGAVYFLQGLAIISFFVQKRSSVFFKVAVYSFLIVFFQVLALFVTTLGVFDIWFDFRKLNKVEEVPEK